MLTMMTKDAAGTLALGRMTAPLLKTGDFICLSGDLGAGKTLFVQGIAAGLEIGERVTSPTFTILQIYDSGKLPLYHFDLYRLESEFELADIGFEEYLRPAGLAVVEWADKFPEHMPDERLWIEIKSGDDAAERRITFAARGERYRNLCEELTKIAAAGIGYSHAGV